MLGTQLLPLGCQHVPPLQWQASVALALALAVALALAQALLSRRLRRQLQRRQAVDIWKVQQWVQAQAGAGPDSLVSAASVALI